MNNNYMDNNYMDTGCMDTDCDRLLKEIMAADFTLIDLHLYLDTHPYDQRTITLYNNCVKRAMLLRHQYEKICGPINPLQYTSPCPWKWIESPWPWE